MYFDIKAVAFTGHRSFKASSEPTLFGQGGDGGDALEAVEPRLECAITELYDEGYRTFLCGMAEGFDLLAAKVLMSMKNVRPDINIVAVIPHPEQSARFGMEAQDIYARVMDAASESIIISGKYTSDCFHRRNDYLVANSDVLVCFFNGNKGGTAYTVAKARRTGHKIINVL